MVFIEVGLLELRFTTILYSANTEVERLYIHKYTMAIDIYILVQSKPQHETRKHFGIPTT